ncbi:heterokaryon incompatibility protein-domain-containing protein, partial [Xylariaceae sp. FL1651]
MGLPRKILIDGKAYFCDPEDGDEYQEDPTFHLQQYDDESLSQIPDYKYEELPKRKKRIRLLVLKSASRETSQIDCKIIEADYGNSFHIPTKRDAHSDSAHNESRRGHSNPRQRLSEKEEQEKREEEARHVLATEIQYEALSWCWGDGQEIYAIRIEMNGKIFKRKIRKELALALRYLRYPDKERTIWVDSICINQDDDSERNHQVQMMSRIYTRAQKVCVWLGKDDDNSNIAINFIKKEVLVLKNFDTICSDKKYAHKWGALMMLMQRPWFSRRWMIQEITLGRTATIHCGPATIDWNDFAVAVELFVEVENATHRLSEVMQKNEKFRHIPGWFEHVSELGASLLVQATGKVFRTQRTRTEAGQLLNVPTTPLEIAKESHAIDPLERRSLLSLQHLVTTMFIFQTSEPRDVIYSLLAVARDASPSAEDSILSDPDNALLMRTGFSSFLEAKPFEVDYGRAYSDVCRDFIQFSIERAYQVDPVQSLDILCRPWSLEPPKEKSTRLNKKPAKKVEREPIMTLNRSWKRRNEIDPRDTKEYFSESERVRKDSENRFKMRKFDYPIANTESDDNSIDGIETNEAESFNDTTARQLQDIKLKHFPEKSSGSSALEEEDIPLPSWVASAKLAPFGLFHHAGSIEKTGRVNADPLVGAPEDGHKNYSAAQAQDMNIKAVRFRKRLVLNHYSLYVKGFLFDEVEVVTDASQDGFIPASWIELGAWDEPEKDYPPDNFWRTLVADRGRDNRNPPYYFARACRESAIKGGLRSGGINTTALINNERNSIIAEFCRRVQAVIWNRRLFKTKRGVLGLGPKNVEKGDKLGIIYGCTVPVILREVEKDRTQKPLEELEDAIEDLKTCIKRSRENRERILLFRKKGIRLDDKTRAHMDKVNEKFLKDYNRRATMKVEEEQEEDKDDLREKSDMVKNQAEANEKDPYRYYNLIGDSYVHGMMDGEALRQKFYKDIPDQTLEI